MLIFHWLSAMGFAKAKFRIVGSRGSLEGIALVDTGAWLTVIDVELAEGIGVKYTGLTVVLTSFSGHKVSCREAVVDSITIEGKVAPLEAFYLILIHLQILYKGPY